MAFRRKEALIAASTPDPPRSLVASAIRVNFSEASYNNWRFRDESWQRELWRLYDIIPEFGFASRWVGACCSRVRIYVARVDELGRIQGEAKDKKIQALSDTLLGGPASKAEALRNIGINLTVTGECYIAGRPSDLTGRDEWFVISSSEMTRLKGSNGTWQWCWGGPDLPMRIDVSTGVVTRVWTPHPARIWCADSPARSCQPVLRELEQLTKYVFSQIDSRLIGAGILLMPNNLDLPKEENVTDNAESLMIRLATAGAASLRGEGTALGVLPHIIETDNVEGWKLLSFESELSKQAMELRKEAVERLGVGMDMPPEVLSGIGDANHWQGYLVDGQGIKVHIEPLMGRICDALTKAYLAPALKLMDLDPARYTYAFDVSPLAVRPQRLTDALNLYDKGILNMQAVREAGNFKESEGQTEEESAKLFVREVILRDPQMFQNQAMREAAGVPEDLIPQSSMIAPTPGSIAPGGGSGPPPPLPPPTGILPNPAGNPLPSESPLNPSNPNNTLGAPPQPKVPGLNASVYSEQHAAVQEMGVIMLAEATVRRALELAGKRLLNQHNRHRWPDVPHFELHTRIQVQDQAHANRCLAGAWDQLEAMTQFMADGFDTPKLQKSLHRYCSILLTRSIAHEPQNLLSMLRSDGVVHGQ